MTKVILFDAPSALYRTQIKNIAARMRDLVSQTVSSPLGDMTAFNKTEKDFDKAKDEALLCCSVMDTASIENRDRADNTTITIMQEMVHLRNDASDLIENEPNEILRNRQFTPEMRNALDVIYNQYRAHIQSDFMLENDFQRLFECVALSQISAAQGCEKIVNHVLAEVNESAGDDQRMADESPSCGSDDSAACRHLQTHLALSQALEGFCVTYLKH
jgi:hypothetical protein